MSDVGQAVSNLATYRYAKEHFLDVLFQSGKITQKQYEKMHDFIYERFQIGSLAKFDIFVPDLPYSQSAIKSSPESVQVSKVEVPVESFVKVETAPITNNNEAATLEYVSLTQLVREYNPDNPGYVIQNWLQNQNTIEFLKLWEEANNPEFNLSACKDIQIKLRDNMFTLTAKYWIEQTNGKSLQSKSGRYGGTFAHPVITCGFLVDISPQFKLALIEMGQSNNCLTDRS